VFISKYIFPKITII